MKNVVLFTLDTLRKDVIGCYGNDEGLTPFIDSIQDKCIRFERSQAVGPYTQASFPGILTSSYYLEFSGGLDFNPRRTLVSEALTRQGITTAGFHSNPYMCDLFGWNRGWSHYYDSMDDEITDLNPYIKCDAINKKVDEYLAGYTAGGASGSLFLWAHYMDVHEPYAPDQKYVDQVDPSIKMSEDEYMTLFTDVVIPRNAADPDKIELCRKLYKAHVIEIDEYVRSFFDILQRHHVLDDSVIIITSDHGDEFGEHGSLSHDGKMHWELINVPLFIYDSSREKGEVCDTLVSGVDIPPTILSLFSIEKQVNYHGQSLLPLDGYHAGGVYGNAIGKLSHKMKETDKPVHYYIEGDLKIIYREEEDAWQMFDLKKDPEELNDIVATSAQAKSMQEQLKALADKYARQS